MIQSLVAMTMNIIINFINYLIHWIYEMEKGQVKCVKSHRCTAEPPSEMKEDVKNLTVSVTGLSTHCCKLHLHVCNKRRAKPHAAGSNMQVHFIVLLQR